MKEKRRSKEQEKRLLNRAKEQEKRLLNRAKEQEKELLKMANAQEKVLLKRVKGKGYGGLHSYTIDILLGGLALVAFVIILIYVLR